MIRKLQAFYNDTGHCQPSHADDPELHRWVGRIRNNYRHQVKPKNSSKNHSIAQRPLLSQQKLEILAEIGFVWDTKEAAWNRHYEELCAFQRKHGHCRVRSVDNRRLWIWTRNLRRDYKQLHRQTHQTSNSTASSTTSPNSPVLTAERLARLDAIGFGATVRTRQHVWDARMAELSEFAAVHGHVNVPQEYADNPALGQWVMNVRTDAKRYLAGLPTGLTAARMAQLELMDFRWNVKEHTWFSMMERLRRHVEQECDNNVQNVSNGELKLWLTKQRHEYQRRLQNRTSYLTPLRIEALEALPNFSWSGRSCSSYRGPSTDDWARLFEGMRAKGIAPGMRPKQHWFEGQNPFQEETKKVWTEEDLVELWYEEEDEDENEEEPYSMEL